MHYTDWKSKTRTFSIEKLSGKQLILNSEGKRYIFRKF
ncbi:lipocalin-like domain-containing protein [Parabacteroides goldsteinii]|nr:lipocalin-like domain-containing protein [Parabacteroides goldsteinii]